MNIQGLLGMGGAQMPGQQQMAPRGMGGLLGGQGMPQGMQQPGMPQGMAGMIDPMSFYGAGAGQGMNAPGYRPFTPAAQQQGGGRFIPQTGPAQQPQAGGMGSVEEMIKMLSAANPYSFNPEEFQWRYDNPGMPTNGRFGE